MLIRKTFWGTLEGSLLDEVAVYRLINGEMCPTGEVIDGVLPPDVDDPPTIPVGAFVGVQHDGKDWRICFCPS